MFKKIAVGLLPGLVVLALFIATRPDTFRIERSVVVSVAPSVVFRLVNSFHQWDGWSPWSKLDPEQKKTYSGPESGEGSVYAWDGNEKVGEGQMSIVAVKSNEEIRLRLEFLKPWQVVNTTIFYFVPQGASTRVVWAMEGHNNFFSKAFGLIMNMDAMVGRDFESGLANLKHLAEATPAH